MVSTAGAGVAPLGAAKLVASWRRHGVPAPPTSPRHKKAVCVGGTGVEEEGFASHPGVLSERKAEHFQQAFAEISSGGCNVAVLHVPALLRTLGVPQPRDVAEQLLPKILSADELRQPKARLSYDDALWLYEQAVLQDIAMAAVNDAVDEFSVEALGGTLATAVNESLGRSPRPLKPGTSSSTAVTTQLPGGTKEQYAMLYRVPPQSSPRMSSIFKKVGRFTVRPNDA